MAWQQTCLVRRSFLCYGLPFLSRSLQSAALSVSVASVSQSLCRLHMILILRTQTKDIMMRQYFILILMKWYESELLKDMSRPLISYGTVWFYKCLP